MSDYYDGNNREEDERVKLGDKVQEWWDDLDELIQIELMEIEYPDKSNFMTIEEMWHGLDWKDKLNIYLEENELTEEAIEAKKADAGDRKAHEIMVEGREIE